MILMIFYIITGFEAKGEQKSGEFIRVVDNIRDLI